MKVSNLLSAFAFLTAVFVSPMFSQQGYSSTLSTSGPVWNNTTLSAHMNELTNKFRNWDGSKLQFSDIRGSMYYDEDFVIGKVYLGTQYYGKYPMRYNAFADEIEAKKTEMHDPQVITKSSMLWFEIGNNKYVLRDYVDFENNLTDGYFMELVSHEKYSLYQKKQKMLREGRKAQTPNQENVPPRFLDANSFYITVGDKNPIKLKNSKKALKDFVPEEQMGKLKKFMKESKINLGEKEDLVELVNFLNTMG